MTQRKEKTRLLREQLLSEAPQHDTPIGLVHPYWARKPLNLIDIIVKNLSKKGDIVYDPFVGSGTIAYSAASNNRKALASDLNPLAIFLTNTILEMSSLSIDDIAQMNAFLNKVERTLSGWFMYDKDRIVERIRYEVKGKYKNGEFQLIPLEATLKRKSSKGWVGRDVESPKKAFQFKIEKKLLNSPVNFEKVSIKENSRIAVPSGSNASHFFDLANRASINFIIKSIEELSAEKRIKSALSLLLSSSLPLLRLSDKKASSQWPYWRPKDVVTSRNPVFILRKRMQAFTEAISWVKTHIKNAPKQSIKTFYDKKKMGYLIIHSAAQDILLSGIKPESVDLIITDPPYADHAPYLEYSELWNRLILRVNGEKNFSREIVKTDAPSRKKDDREYIERLCKGFEKCAISLKDGGYLAFFYIDKDLSHWAEIARTLEGNGLVFQEVIPLPKQRRSMKTVTTPGRTLDGDLLVVAQKTGKPRNNRNKAKHFKRSDYNGRGDLFLRYAALINDGLVNGKIDELASVEKNIYNIL